MKIIQLLSIFQLLSLFISTISVQRVSVALLTFEKEYVCTGTIIDEKWILTAAHPLVDYQAFDLHAISAENYKNGIGRNDKVWFSDVERIVIHEYFDKTLHWNKRQKPPNDIAMVKTKNSITMGLKVGNPVRMAFLPFQINRLRDSIDHYKLEAVSFGPTKEDGPLHFNQVEIVDNEECKKLNDFLETTSGYFCSIGVNGTRLCDEDAGAGILIHNKWIIGVVSLTRGCFEENIPSISIIIPVYDYLDWIRTNFDKYRL